MDNWYPKKQSRNTKELSFITQGLENKPPHSLGVESNRSIKRNLEKAMIQNER
jgi:hypothetical protein